MSLSVGSRSAGELLVVLDVPDDFHQVPLETDIQQRTASQLQVLEEMGISDRGQREALGLYLEALAVRLSAGNVIGTAFCAVQLDGHPSTATLTVGLQPTHSLDRGLVVLAAAEAMRREGRYHSVEVRELGQHSAVAAIAEQPTVPGDIATGEVGTTLRELSVVVPVPSHEHVLMVTLATPCLEDWDVYEKLVHDLCRTMRVRDTQPDVIR